MCLLSFLKWGSIGIFLGIVQWDFTRRDHLGNPRRVSGSGLVMSTKCHCSIFGRNCEMIIYGTRNVVLEQG